MSTPKKLSHESLSYSNGFLFDDDLNCYMVWKQHEFSRWWRCFESLFNHPLSRIFINSVVDDLEYHNRLFLSKGFFKKKKFVHQVSNLTQFYGSGTVDLTKNQILNGAHSLFSVGLASYALEVFHQTRYKIRWNEPTPLMVQLSLETNSDLPPPSSVQPFPWSEKLGEMSELNTDYLSGLLHVKKLGHLEIDGERHLIVPSSLLERFVSTCLPHAPDMSEADWIQCPSDWSKSDASILALLIESTSELFSLSERSVYITAKESWKAYFQVYMSESGWGQGEVVSYDIHTFETIITFPKTSVTPFSIGLAAGIWQRAHGRKFRLIIHDMDKFIQLNICSLLDYENVS